MLKDELTEAIKNWRAIHVDEDRKYQGNPDYVQLAEIHELADELMAIIDDYVRP